MTARTGPVTALQGSDVSVHSPGAAFDVAPVEFLDRDPISGIILGPDGLADNGSRRCSEDYRPRVRTKTDR